MAEPQYIPVDYDPFENAPPSSALEGASDNRDMLPPQDQLWRAGGPTPTMPNWGQLQDSGVFTAPHRPPAGDAVLPAGEPLPFADTTPRTRPYDAILRTDATGTPGFIPTGALADEFGQMAGERSPLQRISMTAPSRASPESGYQDVIFGGEKGAKTAPQGAGPGLPVEEAKKREKTGLSALENFNQTGWYRGPDEQWKWILSDKGASLNPGAFTTYNTGLPGDPSGREEVSLKAGWPRKLPEVLNHPDLYKTYPQLKDVNVDRLPVTDRKGALADFDPKTNTIRITGFRSATDVTTSILHELQHAVQKNEEFGRGSNFTENLPLEVQRGERGPTEEEKDQAFEAYLISSGEVEARQVEKQFKNQDWSKLPTRFGPGWPTPDQQLVRRNGTLSTGKSYQLEEVDHDPFATEPYDLAAKDYPILKQQGVMAVPGRGGNMEFWSPNEPGTPDKPRPNNIPMDQPGVELGVNSKPLDVLGDIVSHHMVKKDPVIKKYYESFINSLTPDQKGRLAQQYEYHVQNEGEQRSYEKWEEQVGIPAYFRGYAFKQWPDEFNRVGYTPEQRAHFDQMMGYLSKAVEPSALGARN